MGESDSCKMTYHGSIMVSVTELAKINAKKMLKFDHLQDFQ